MRLRHSKAGFIGLAVAALTLVGCSSANEVSEVGPVSFENVDELFEAVDRQLGCPAETSGDYAFDAGAEHGLVTGRSCAESVIMVHADDEAVITEVQERMSTTQGGPLPIVHDDTWFVIDITEVAAEGADLAHPDSRDLEDLATAFRADYTEL